MIIIRKKYFGFVSRFELMRTEQYHFTATIRGKDVKGMHLFIGKIYFSLYIRIGRENV